MVAIYEIAGAKTGNVIGNGDHSAHRIHAWHEGKRREHAHRRIDCVGDRAGYEAGKDLDHCGAGKGCRVRDIFDGK
jgi:hypothetical protein